jgi:hypothetical protein
VLFVNLCFAPHLATDLFAGGRSAGPTDEHHRKIRSNSGLMNRLDGVYDIVLDAKFNVNYKTIIEYNYKNTLILLYYS